MFRALIAWMDRDWARRNYNSLFAYRQRLVWCAPLFVSIAVISLLDAFGFSRDSSAALTVFALGATGMFAIMLVSLYRWAIGYSRSDFQEQAAAKHRARVAARHAFIRRWFRRNSG